MMYAESDLYKRVKAEENAARDDLQAVLAAYQGNRTPENRKAYLDALSEFSKLVTGRTERC